MDFQFIRALVELMGEKAIYEKKCKKKREKRKIKPKGFTLN